MAFFENINLEKGMYNVAGKSFSEVLESLDSTKNYEGTELSSLDAFERQLKRYGIKVGGKTSDRVEKFFGSAGSATLFPEYVARAVASGMEASDKVGDIVATVTKTDALDYRPITAEAPAAGLEATDEGEAMPKTSIKSAANLINLRKHGRVLESSYEALRFQRLDLFTVALRQIGKVIAASQIKDAVSALENGDGNVAGIDFIDAADLTYADFVALWGELAPYRLTTVLAGTEALQKIMQLPEFKDSMAGQSFHGTGKMITPLGAKLVHVPSMESGKIIGIDKDAALEMVQAGEIMTEADKLIDRQLDRAAISVISGFSRIYPGAAAGISYAE